jgi:hypothetical protein
VALDLRQNHHDRCPPSQLVREIKHSAAKLTMAATNRINKQYSYKLQMSAGQPHPQLIASD